MFAGTVIVSVLLAAALVVTAARKLSHRRPVVESYLRVGVPEHRLNQLAAILVAGAAGPLLGLWLAPLGAAAAAGLTGYFLIAIGFHLRARDARHLPNPVLFLALSVAALVLRLVTL